MWLTQETALSVAQGYTNSTKRNVKNRDVFLNTPSTSSFRVEYAHDIAGKA